MFLRSAVMNAKKRGSTDRRAAQNHRRNGCHYNPMKNPYSTSTLTSSEKSILPEGRWKKAAFTAFSVP